MQEDFSPSLFLPLSPTLTVSLKSIQYFEINIAGGAVQRKEARSSAKRLCRFSSLFSNARNQAKKPYTLKKEELFLSSSSPVIGYYTFFILFSDLSISAITTTANIINFATPQITDNTV